MSAFPWDNLITATATLSAALGSVGLRSHSDRKTRAEEFKRADASADADRQSAANGALVASATEMLHIFRRQHEIGYWTDVPAGQEVDLRGRAARASGELFRAVAEVELVGPTDARATAAKLRRSATDAGDALTYGDQQDAIDPLADFESAIGAFIDAVRP